MENIAVESPRNYEQKCCVAFVLDVSGSMDGKPINELNAGLQLFQREILDDPTSANRLEVAIVEFASTVQTLVDPQLMDTFTMPTLTTKGTTALVDGVREGIAVVRSRKQYYKNSGQPYYRPWVILITDGSPDSGQDIEGLKQEIAEGAAIKDFNFFAIGVDGADMKTLQYISSSGMPPAPLKGLSFSAFFKWLSISLGAQGVTGSHEDAKINLPDPTAWMKGFVVS